MDHVREAAIRHINAPLGKDPTGERTNSWDALEQVIRMTLYVELARVYPAFKLDDIRITWNRSKKWYEIWIFGHRHAFDSPLFAEHGFQPIIDFFLRCAKQWT